MSAPARTVWPAVFLAIFSGIVAAAAVGKVPPALPQIRNQLGLSMVDAGWVVSTFSTLGTFCALLFGGACERIGQLRFTLLGFIVLSLGALLGACAQDYATLLASRILEGSGFIAVVVGVPGLIARSTAPRDYRLALSLWSIYLPVGISATMLAAPFLLPTLGWRGLWLLLAAPALGCAALLYRRRDHFAGQAQHQHADSGMIRQTLRLPGPWLLSLAFLTYALQWLALMVWMPSFLMEQRALSPVLASALTAAMIAANVPGNLLGGWLVHRNVPRGALIAGTSGFMLVCAFGIFNDGLSDTVRYALCLLFTSVGGMLPAAAFSGMAAHAPSPRHIGIVNGLMVQGANLGQLAGPPAVAAAVSLAGSWQAASGVMTVGAIAGLVAGLGLMAVESARSAGSTKLASDSPAPGPRGA